MGDCMVQDQSSLAIVASNVLHNGWHKSYDKYWASLKWDATKNEADDKELSSWEIGNCFLEDCSEPEWTKREKINIYSTFGGNFAKGLCGLFSFIISDTPLNIIIMFSAPHI